MNDDATHESSNRLEELKIREKQLQIRQLERPFWKNPQSIGLVIVPALTIAFTVMIAYGQGWFDAERHSLRAEVGKLNSQLATSNSENSRNVEYIAAVREISGIDAAVLITTDSDVVVHHVSFAPISPILDIEDLSIDVARYHPPKKRQRVDIDRILPHLRHISNIQTLEIDSDHFTASDAGLRSIRKLNDLRRVIVSGDLAKPVIDQLVLLPDVESVIIDDLTDDDTLSTIPNLRQVTFVSLEGTFTDAGLETLTSLSSLRSVSISSPHISAAGIEKICEIKDLEQLRICGGHDLDESCLEHISQLRNLRVLLYKGGIVSNAGLSLVGRLRTLEYLSLANCEHVDDAGMQDLRHLNKLRGLELKETAVQNVGLDALKSMPYLVELWLQQSQVNDKGLEKICENRNLELLDICGSRVTNDGLKSVCQLKKLETICLGASQLTDAALENFRHLPNLQEIDLVSSQNLSDKALRQLSMENSGVQISR